MASRPGRAGRPSFLIVAGRSRLESSQLHQRRVTGLFACEDAAGMAQSRFCDLLHLRKMRAWRPLLPRFAASLRAVHGPHDMLRPGMMLVASADNNSVVSIGAVS